VRAHGQERIEVLLMCIPRAVVQSYLDALGDAGVQPRGVVLASTAIGDYLAFCRGITNEPIGLLLTGDQAVEFALLAGGRLLASQWLPATRVATPADLSRALARELADEMVSPDDLKIFRWELGNGSAPTLPAMGEANLPALAEGRLAAAPEFFEGREHALLPAVGAALEAVREGTVPVNLLPSEQRGRADEALSLWTLGLAAAALILLVVWGLSALAKDQLLAYQMRNEIAAIEPKVREVKHLQDEIDLLRKQVDILSPGSEPQVTVLLKELSDAIPPDAYLTSLNLRNGRLTLDGLATAASGIITKLEGSRHFKNANFTSPITKQGDKDRFTLTAEIER
jgi:Tfp pilus assembly protein PilN